MDEFGWALGHLPQAAKYMIEVKAIDPANPGLVFQETTGSDQFHVELVQMMLDRGARPTNADLAQLKKVMNANEWLRKRGIVQKLVAMYEANLAPGTQPASATRSLSPQETQTRDLRLRAAQADGGIQDSRARDFRSRSFSKDGRLRPD